MWDDDTLDEEHDAPPRLPSVSLIGRVWPYLRPHRWAFLTAVVLSLSGVALVVCAAWFVFSWNWARLGLEGDEMMFDTRRSMARILGGVVTFLWIHVELSRTVSLDVSTFLLVAYYAVSGVLAIGIGRWRAIPLLRQVGLALAVFAAFKAMMETSALSIGWRVGGYMLAGIFLLGVAYWYRGRGAPEATTGGAAAAG